VGEPARWSPHYAYDQQAGFFARAGNAVRAEKAVIGSWDQRRVGT